MTRQKLGQNFLQDRRIAARIADTVLEGNCTIVEIGPGKGIMTGILAEAPGRRKIIAIEKDEELYTNLISSEALRGVEILNKDILKFKIGENSGKEKVTILGNIPYNISKEILDWIIKENQFVINGTLMVQKEFFLKITSEPGSKIYNAQSVMYGLLFESVKLFEVKPGSFSPPPKVTSTVFSFTKRGQALFSTDPPKSPLKKGDFDSHSFFDKRRVLSHNTSLGKGGGKAGGIAGLYKMLKTAFIHRRKTLVKNLGKDYNKDSIKEFLVKEDLRTDIRAEDMDRDHFKKLYLSLK